MGRAKCVSLRINLEMADGYLYILNEDYGIGRKTAEDKVILSGGLKIAGECFDILRHMNKRPISHRITDICDNNGRSSGTRV